MRAVWSCWVLGMGDGMGWVLRVGLVEVVGGAGFVRVVVGCLWQFVRRSGGDQTEDGLVASE